MTSHVGLVLDGLAHAANHVVSGKHLEDAQELLGDGEHLRVHRCRGTLVQGVRRGLGRCQRNVVAPQRLLDLLLVHVQVERHALGNEHLALRCDERRERGKRVRALQVAGQARLVLVEQELDAGHAVVGHADGLWRMTDLQQADELVSGAVEVSRALEARHHAQMRDGGERGNREGTSCVFASDLQEARGRLLGANDER